MIEFIGSGVNLIDKSIYNLPDSLFWELDLAGWNGNSLVFHSLIDEVNPKLIIEVGSWKGQSSMNMCNYLKKKSDDFKIICVDTWLGASEFWTWGNDNQRNLQLKNGYPSIYYQFLSNVKHTQNEEYILPFPITSSIGAEYFTHFGIKADMIYIDASHTYHDVLNDLNKYYPLLNEGGLIFGDDYIDFWSGVKMAVNEFVNSNELSLQIYENNFWIIRK